MWWNKKFDRWISICIENPLKTWKLAKKYFKKPKIKIHFFTNPIYDCPYMSLNSIAKIIDIEAFDVCWKDKYDSPRHERSPYIWVCFFKKFGFSISWHIYYQDEFDIKQDGDAFYWEFLLDYLYYKKSLKNYPVWTSSSLLYKYEDDNDVYTPITFVIPVVSMSLNKTGIKELKKLI